MPCIGLSYIVITLILLASSLSESSLKHHDHHTDLFLQGISVEPDDEYDDHYVDLDEDDFVDDDANGGGVHFFFGGGPKCSSTDKSKLIET